MSNSDTRVCLAFQLALVAVGLDIRAADRLIDLGAAAAAVCTFHVTNCCSAVLSVRGAAAAEGSLDGPITSAMMACKHAPHFYEQRTTYGSMNERNL